ncbi:imidazole glycerol phosphate synthase subunit HisH [Candidatus Phycosocius spiralis]|uniref:Imidazole glycerol phosphate synthase subunit HisH n=1 Tax=Candidatus Phycosocius spiralis TaxID=2815099 RepID=A0ABQ4PUS6_9PROT|nr:imidazole glycerol phosphate synthase subunit HisH [Candidatus Phycosocius spiralis]GIU66733.1 imidazole glycerol phosphate synthase subunit HisH [Candidatus Phycosocius spiralis]
MLALIDYGSGNIRSAQKALEAAGARDVRVTADPDLITRADQILLPGVGAFGDCVANLAGVPGLRAAIEARVMVDGVPFLGICVGMQLMAEMSIEFGTTPGLGWIKGVVSVLKPGDRQLKIPHMGWNRAEPSSDCQFMATWDGPQDVYFVHSYAFRAVNPSEVAAWCSYGEERFAAAIQKDNLFGVQFHPEKSQKAGLLLLEEWLKL